MQDGCTALVHAVERKDKPIVELLLDSGADLDTANNVRVGRIQCDLKITLKLDHDCYDESVHGHCVWGSILRVILRCDSMLIFALASAGCDECREPYDS